MDDIYIFLTTADGNEEQSKLTKILWNTKLECFSKKTLELWYLKILCKLERCNRNEVNDGKVICTKQRERIWVIIERQFVFQRESGISENNDLCSWSSISWNMQPTILDGEQPRLVNLV